MSDDMSFSEIMEYCGRDGEGFLTAFCYQQQAKLIGDDPVEKFDIQKDYMDYVFWLEGVPHMLTWGLWYWYESLWAVWTYWTWDYPRLKPGNSDQAFLDKNKEFGGYWNFTIALWKYYVPMQYIAGYWTMFFFSFGRTLLAWIGLGDGPFVEMFDWVFRHVSVQYLDFRNYEDGEWSNFLWQTQALVPFFWFASIFQWLFWGVWVQLWCFIFPCQPFTYK